MLNQKNIKAFKIVIIVIAVILLGFLKDYLFVHVNVVLYNKWTNSNYPTPSAFRFLYQFDYWTIYYSKWVITPAFLVSYYLLNHILIKFIFQKSYFRWLLIIYLVFIALMVISFGIGFLVGLPDKGYRFTRMLMGVMQSPVPAMFLTPVIYLKNKYEKNNI